MEQQPNQDLFNDLTFDQTARQYIRSAATWAMTIVVVAVIGYVIVFINLFTQDEMAIRATEGFDLKQMLRSDTITSAIISTGLGLLINFFLYRFASQSKSALDGLNQRQLVSGFNNLKVYFVILSVIMIILFVCILLLFVYGATRTI